MRGASRSQGFKILKWLVREAIETVRDSARSSAALLSDETILAHGNSLARRDNGLFKKATCKKAGDSGWWQGPDGFQEIRQRVPWIRSIKL